MPRPLPARRCWYLELLVVGLVHSSGLVAVGEEGQPRVLMVTESRGFVHNPVKRLEGDLAPSEVAMRQLSLSTKAFRLELSQDSASAITRDNLSRFDIVMFYTTGKLPISDENLHYFIHDWLKQPKHGFLGVHSATDTLKEDSRYVELVGGSFDGHPWTQNTQVTIVNHEPTHPTMVPFDRQLVLREEIYQYKNWLPENVRVLMSLEMSGCDVKRPYHVPVAWVRSWGQGRVYYNNLGHRPDTWQNPAFMQGMVAAIRWLAGQSDGPTAPNPELSRAAQESAVKVCAALGITPESVAAEEAAKARARAEQAKKKSATPAAR